MAITGEITTYLDALRQPVDHKRVQDAFALAQPGTPEDEYRQRGASYQLYPAKEAGVSYKFKNGRLLRVAIYLDEYVGGYAPYARPDAVIDGLGSGSTRADVLRVLGAPAVEFDDSDQFEIAGKKVATMYEGDRLTSIVPMIAPV